MEILEFIFYGCIAGLIYLVCAFIRGCFNYNIILTILLDIFWGAAAVLIFGICLVSHFEGIFKVYEALGYIIGMIIVRISLGNLVATSSNFVYNKIVINVTNKVKILLKGIISGSKKINKSSKISN